VEEDGAVAFGLDAGAVEPEVAAKRGDHLVDERSAALVRSSGDGGGARWGCPPPGSGRVAARGECGEGTRARRFMRDLFSGAADAAEVRWLDVGGGPVGCSGGAVCLLDRCYRHVPLPLNAHNLQNK